MFSLGLVVSPHVAVNALAAKCVAPGVFAWYRHMYNFVGYSQFRNPAAYCCPRTGRRIMYWLPVDYDCPSSGGEAASQARDASSVRDASTEACQDKKGEGTRKGKGSGNKTGLKANHSKGADRAPGSAVSSSTTEAEKGQKQKGVSPGRTVKDGDKLAGDKKKKRQPKLQQLPLLHDDLLLHPVAEGVFAKQQRASVAASQDGQGGAAGGAGKGTGTLMWGPYVQLAPGEEPVKDCTVVDTSEGRICIKLVTRQSDHLALRRGPGPRMQDCCCSSVSLFSVISLYVVSTLRFIFLFVL